MMDTPPIGFGRAPAFGPGKFTPQQELKTLLETLGQIHAQMSQNSGNVRLVGHLHKECQETLGKIDGFTAELPSSQRDGFNDHLESLRGQLQKSTDQLMTGAPADELRQSNFAVTTTLSLLHRDLGFTAPKSSLY